MTTTNNDFIIITASFGILDRVELNQNDQEESDESEHFGWEHFCWFLGWFLDWTGQIHIKYFSDYKFTEIKLFKSIVNIVLSIRDAGELSMIDIQPGIFRDGIDGLTEGKMI
ncbi:hypothetical protein BLOT_016350, partial [Blomia tropicalis]